MISRSSYSSLVNHLAIIAIAFFVTLIMSSALALWVGEWFVADSRSSYLAQSAVQNIFCFIATAFISAWFISRRPISFLALSQKCSWRAFAGVVIAYLIAIPALNQLIFYNESMQLPGSMASLEESLRSMENEAALLTSKLVSATSVGSLISGILLIGGLTGFSEEILFRGTIQRTLRAYNPSSHWAIWIAAFFFSFVHMQFFGFFPRLLLGAFFGYVLYSTGSIWPAMFAHALNNSCVVVSYWLENRYPESGVAFESIGVSSSGFPILAFLSLLATTLFFIFFYKYFFFQKLDNGKNSQTE